MVSIGSTDVITIMKQDGLDPCKRICRLSPGHNEHWVIHCARFRGLTGLPGYISFQARHNSSWLLRNSSTMGLGKSLLATHLRLRAMVMLIGPPRTEDSPIMSHI